MSTTSMASITSGNSINTLNLESLDYEFLKMYMLAYNNLDFTMRGSAQQIGFYSHSETMSILNSQMSSSHYGCVNASV